MLDANPAYRILLALDIERSAGRGDVALQEIRRVLEGAVRRSCSSSNIDWDCCHREDTGDGMRLIAGPEIPKTQFVYPFMDTLARQLHAHNRTAGPTTTVRVRAAVHAGDVHLNDGRFAGSSLETLARLLDAPPLKAALRNAPTATTVALAVSEHIYESVVQHGYVGIDPETYAPVRCTLKERSFTAWLHLPGGGPPVDVTPGRGEYDERRPRPSVAADGSGDGVIAIPAGTAFHGGNVAIGSTVRDQHTYHGNRFDHVAGDIRVGAGGAPDSGLREQLAELRRLLTVRHHDGQLNETDFTAADAELGAAERYASGADSDSRKKLVSALKKVKGLVEDVADLAARVAALISAVRGL